MRCKYVKVLLVASIAIIGFKVNLTVEAEELKINVVENVTEIEGKVERKEKTVTETEELKEETAIFEDKNEDDNIAIEKYYGWHKDQVGNWYYYDQEGEMVTGWLWNGDHWCYLEDEAGECQGIKLTNCMKTVGNNTYFLDESGIMKTGWILRPEGYYYANECGVIETGWRYIGNYWYYLDGEDEKYPGLMYQDVKTDIGGNTYFFGKSGNMQTGWVLYPEGYYYTNGSGVIETGWQYIGNYWYYLDGENEEYPGLMYQDMKKNINGNTYFFGKSGNMQTGWVLYPEGYYYTNGSGVIETGWQYIGNYWYYLDGENEEYPGLMLRNTRTVINGNDYFFGKSGNMQIGWVLCPEGWYYTSVYGTIQTGWQRVGSTWYYLEQNLERRGIMVTGWQKINGNHYYFYGGGAMATNWLLYNSEWYYMADDGAMKTGWVNIDKKWYYFYLAEDPNIEGNKHGVMATNTTIDGWEIRENGVAISELDKKIEGIKKYVGAPYVYGGVTPLGWDCSGFTQWALLCLGVEIPRTSVLQAMGGITVNKNDISSWRPGDILAYTNTSGQIGHVALYLGDGKLMHALNTKYDTLIQGVSEYERWDSKTSLSVVKRYL